MSQSVVPWLDVRRLLWMGSVGLSSAVAGAVGQTLSRWLWKLLWKKDPPESPDLSTTTWHDALLWTVTASIVGGLAVISMQRIMHTGWRYVTGEQPPG